MKRGLFLVLTLFLSIAGYAYDIAVKNAAGVEIYYNYSSDGKELSVTSGDIKYSGSVVIPEDVTYMNRTRKVTGIGSHAFSQCKGLSSVTIPNSVTLIEDKAFSDCPSLISIIIPKSVTSIGDYAFSNCSGLTSVTIPNSVISIGKGAFRNCSGLTSVTIPNSVISIGSYAFEICSGLTSVTIGNSVTSIGEMAFSGCSGLTSVTIGNSVTSIGFEAFSSCSGLTSVTIPDSVTSLGYGAFSGCSGLTSVTIGNSVTSIGDYAFYYCRGLTSVTIGNSVTSIGKGAFYNCINLTSVTIPNSVTSLGSDAFCWCTNLTSVTIGNSVTSLGLGAFSVCYRLTSIISLIQNPFPFTGKSSNSNRTFDLDTFNNATLYVPKGTIYKYKATEGWKDFVFIEESEGSGSGSEQSEVKKCATPSINYTNKRLMFSCETEGVEYVYEIKDTDIKNGNGSTVDLSATYEIIVYATKSGYENSNLATATLVWTEAIFTETTEKPTSAKAIRESIPMLISTNSGNITVKSEANGQAVAAYTIDGQFLGNATISNGQAVVPTTLQNGNVAIVKVGSKSVKIVMQ